LRDYDKEPIIIRDYGTVFGCILGIVVIFCLIVFISYKLFSGIYIDKDFTYVDIGFSCALIVVLLIALFIILPKEAKEKLGIFKFTNEKIHYSIFKENKNPDYVEIFDEYMAYTKYIKQVSFCIVSDLKDRYGRKHYLSSWGLFRKSSIAIPLEKLFIFTLYLIEYLLVLPLKIYKLKKVNEPLYLLKKNIIVEFSNRNYFIINIYSQKEFDEIMRYFISKKVHVENKTVFLYHCQAVDYRRIFPSKEEEWCDDFEPQKIENKTGIVKRIFGLFGDKK
jgi:hypothetical protein